VTAVNPTGGRDGRRFKRLDHEGQRKKTENWGKLLKQSHLAAIKPKTYKNNPKRAVSEQIQNIRKGVVFFWWVGQLQSFKKKSRRPSNENKKGGEPWRTSGGREGRHKEKFR